MITLMHGDCLERMKEIETGSVDMILTDPPYGMDLMPQRASAKFHNNKIKNDDHLSWCDAFFIESYRVTKKDTASMFFCNHYCVSEFIASSKKAGYEVKNLIVWDKGHFGMGGNWRPSHEMILVCVKGRFVTHSRNLKTIIKFKKVHHSRASHPTEKPIDLLEHLIFEPDYDPLVVLDPFMGSGSTGVAAKKLNRNFIGIELDKGYFDIAKERIEAA
ncbi:DNA methylase [Vibrio phage 1.123.O._10N.286.48.F3]|nr:DNA methylase [Vibrio phage 1.123.O._10N.286.48.F3]